MTGTTFGLNQLIGEARLDLVEGGNGVLHLLPLLARAVQLCSFATFAGTSGGLEL